MLIQGDCLDVLKTLADNSIDAVVTDPPYGIRFMGKAWDGADIEKRWKADERSRATRTIVRNGWEDKGSPPPICGPAAAAGSYDLTPKGMAAFQQFTLEYATECLRVLKPGGHLASFSSCRTYHRMACAIEDAGFEIRDQLAWAYGSGFPKSHDISKAIDKDAGIWRGRAGAIVSENGSMSAANYERTDKGKPATDAARQWEGWGTALKPAWEPICLARKPLSESTVAANVLRWGTGAINVDATRIGAGEYRQSTTGGMGRKANPVYGKFANQDVSRTETTLGRWPANLCHDGSQEVLDLFPESKSSASGYNWADSNNDNPTRIAHNIKTGVHFGDSGSAARFFYCAKASKADRAGSKHPTVKPVKLMRWICRMLCPPNGTILDPFAGSGTTGQAAINEGFRVIMVERESEYIADIERRLSITAEQPTPAMAAE